MSVPEISVDDLAAKQAAGAPIVDVREPDEWETYHVPGAVLIPLGDLVERVDEVPETDTVYIICATGARSGRAAEHLRRIGIDAVNVAGGIKAWAAAGHPVESGP